MILKSHSKTTRRFSDDELNEQVNDVAIGCGFSEDVTEPREDEDVTTSVAIPARRRRLVHVENAGACNNQTNFYCWMTCLEIPDVADAPAKLAAGESLYCLDPSVLNDNNDGGADGTIEGCDDGTDEGIEEAS